MRFELLLACVVLLPDSCNSHPPAVRSLYPLIGENEATCDASLSGVWIRDSAASEDERWLVDDLDSSDSSCVLYLVITDSAIARILTDTLEVEWIADGGWRRDTVLRRRLSKKQFRRDSARVASWADSALESGWEVRLVRSPAGLFADLSRDPEYLSLVGGSGIRTHWMWKAIPGESSLVLERFSASWLRRMSDSGQVTVSHSNIEGDFVVTATGEELLGLMGRFAEDTGAFPRKGSIRLHR